MPGPGFIHFGQNATAEFLKGLTCERLIPKTVKGFVKFEWHNPPGARNEPLDTAVYCAAMVELVSREFAKGTMWDQLEAQALARRRGIAQPEPAQQRSKPAADWLNRGGLADRRRNWLK